MALRVLLADESVTIKKVIQLALQDFAVEVKAVPVGLDVLEVSKTFQPDLVFADILLQKRSGYEVCADLKKDPATAAVPVVLMWSSFMELDQKQVESCGADGKLEKPFEVEALRKLVLQLVPRTRSQRLAHFLDFPASIAAPLKTNQAQPAAKPASAPPAVTSAPTPPKAAAEPPPTGPATSGFTLTRTPGIPERPAEPGREAPLGALPDLQLDSSGGGSAPAPSNWNMESFAPVDLAAINLDAPMTDFGASGEADEDDAFKPIQLPPVAPSQSPPPQKLRQQKQNEADEEADQWSNRSLEKYRLAPLKPEESLGLDDRTPEWGARPQKPSAPPPPTRTNVDSTFEKTEIIPPRAPNNRPEEVAEFIFNDEEFERTDKLEIEEIVPEQRTRPTIVRELLKDPDFSLSGVPAEAENEVLNFTNPTAARPSEAAVDLSAAGQPSGRSGAGSKSEEPGLSEERIEAMIRQRLEPVLAKTVERIVSQLLPELLPPIAERIIKRELERLLEDSSS